MAPFILPGTVVSVALLSAFSGKSAIPLGGTYTIIIIAYMVRRTPYVYRSVAASLTQLNPSLEEASTIAGAHWIYTFRRVSVPLILPGIISGSILTFSTLLQELSTTILLYGARTRTVPIQIYGAVADGKMGEASALSGFCSRGVRDRLRDEQEQGQGFIGGIEDVDSSPNLSEDRPGSPGGLFAFICLSAHPGIIPSLRPCAPLRSGPGGPRIPVPDQALQMPEKLSQR